jgi:hypothetical protein
MVLGIFIVDQSLILREKLFFVELETFLGWPHNRLIGQFGNCKVQHKTQSKYHDLTEIGSFYVEGGGRIPEVGSTSIRDLFTSFLFFEIVGSFSELSPPDITVNWMKNKYRDHASVLILDHPMHRLVKYYDQFIRYNNLDKQPENETLWDVGSIDVTLKI